MKFSVLMSVYKNDNPDFVRQAIESIIDQTVKPSEIVIVQDGPIPNEIKKLIFDYKTNYSFFKIVELKENKGLGKALNIGLEHCSYEIVARMDSDDICEKDRFEKQIIEFENDEKLSLLGGAISEFIKKPEESVGIRNVPLTEEEIADYIKFRNPFNHMTVMFRKKDVLESGNYLSFDLYEDYYLWVRMFLKNMKLKNIASVLVNARVGKDMYKRRGRLELL